MSPESATGPVQAGAPAAEPAADPAAPAVPQNPDPAESPPVPEQGTRREANAGARRHRDSEDPTDVADERNDDRDSPDDFIRSNPTLRSFTSRRGSEFRIEDLTNAGPSAFGDRATVIGNLSFGQGSSKPRFFADRISDLTARRHTFVRPPHFGELRDRLRRYPVVGLAGPVGSGRSTAACVALAEHLGSDEVMEIVVPPGLDDVRLIREQPEFLEKGVGYIVKVGGRQVRSAVRSIEAVFQENDCSGVIIRDTEEPEASRHRAEVFHHSSVSRVDVFRQHLLYYLREKCVDNCTDCDRSCGRAYTVQMLTPEVRRLLDLLTRPSECVLHAETIARELPADANGVVALLPSENKRYRDKARQILLLPEDKEAVFQNRPVQHRRALRIAYAVFAGQSMARVSEGAGLLLGKLDRLFNEPAIGRPALLNDMPALLGQELGADWHDRATEGESSHTAARVAHIKPEMVRAILDVAWNDFDNTRPALVEWIDELAAHPAPGFSNCAAVAAAIFATHDFEQVYEEVIRRWARDRKRGRRKAAAAAMASAANLDGAVAVGLRVSSQVRADVGKKLEWLAHSRSVLERDTAAMVWGMGYTPRHPFQTARALTAVAANANASSIWTVTDAIENLSRKYGSAWTVNVLSWWLDSDDATLRAGATHAFLNWLEEPLTERVDQLVALLEAQPSMVDRLATLWRVVLLDPGCSVAAWRRLAAWLRGGASDARLREPVRALAIRLAAEPAIRSRLNYWLSKASTTSPSPA